MADLSKLAQTDDLFVRLLREKVRADLRAKLLPEMTAVLDGVVNEAVATLDIDIKRYRNEYKMSDYFDVEVKRRGG